MTRQAGPVLTSWGVRARGLTDGQVVTLVVGLGVELLARHGSGRPYGPLHPAHVRLDAVRRPHLVDVADTPGWTPHDDWVSLLRLGRVVATEAWAAQLPAASGGREGHELLHWLLTQVVPEPLPAAAFPPLGLSAPQPRPGARRAQLLAPARSWGP